MNAQWLFEEDVFEEGIDRFVQEARRQGMIAKVASYIPSQSGISYLNLFEPDSCVIFYGSLNFAAQLAREASWVPGVYLREANYHCSEYYPYFGKYLLAQDYVMIPYGELLRKQDFLFEFLGEDDSIFVRPNSGLKIFTGQLADRANFTRQHQRMGFYDVKPGEICVVSRPRNIIGEWRFVVADRKIIAGSQYRIENRRELARSWPGEAWDLAKQVAASGWQPDRAWTLDICQTKAAFYLLEIGTFCCAGLYECDPEPIIREVSQIALEDWNEMHSG